jgi:hypothetical protein
MRARRVASLVVCLALVAGACRPATPSDRVRKHVETREARFAGKLRLSQEDVPKLPLAGLELWQVSVEVPDVFPLRCFATPTDVFCEGDDGKPRGALERLARAYHLGEHPEALSDADWIALVRFDTGGVIADDAAKVRQMLPGVPQAVLDRVRAPAVTRPPGGGVELAFFVVTIGNTIGPMGLDAARVRVERDGSVRAATDEIHRRNF